MTLVQQSSHITVTLPGSKKKKRKNEWRNEIKRDNLTHDPWCGQHGSVSRKIIWEYKLMNKMGFCETKVKSFGTRMWKCSLFLFEIKKWKWKKEVAHLFQKTMICFDQEVVVLKGFTI